MNRLRRRLDELEEGVLGDATPAPPVADPTDRPVAVDRYVRFLGADLRIAARGFRVRFDGRFHRPPTGWMPTTALQCNTALPVTRLYVMRVRVGGVVPMVATDTYIAGQGRMIGKVLGRTVADGRGPEFDVSELVTWLNDAVLLAPELLVAVGATFEDLGRDRFGVRLTDRGLTVSAEVELDADGAPRSFRTLDRFADLPDGPVRAPWETPILGWQRTVGGRAVPTTAEAVWLLDEGPLTYVRGGFDPRSFELIRPPAPPPAR